MSKERARLRAERERQAAADAVRREAEAAREARRTARHERLTGWLPRAAPVAAGSLAEKQRRATRAVLLLVLVVNVLVWLATDDWAARSLVLLLSLLLTPVSLILVSRK